MGEQKQRLTAATAAVLAITLACVLLVDRPLAAWSHAVFPGTRLFAAAEAIFLPLDPLLLFGAALLLVAGALKLARKTLPPWLARIARGGAAAGTTLALAIVLKVVVGRSQAYPEFLRLHLYELRPLSAAHGFMAFPSATMATMTAFLGAMRPTRSPGKMAAVVVLATYAVALIVTNGHWLSDIVGGTALGVLIGRSFETRDR